MFTLVTSNHQASKKNRITKSEVDLILLVDSNGRYIQMKRLCPNLTAKKVPCPTISDVRKVLDSYKDLSNAKPSTIICHFGTNDLEHSSSQDFIQSFCNTISELCKVFPSSKIIVSELLPRLDHFDASKSHCNSQIHRKCATLPNEHFISPLQKSQFLNKAKQDNFSHFEQNYLVPGARKYFSSRILVEMFFLVSRHIFYRVSQKKRPAFGRLLLPD